MSEMFYVLRMGINPQNLPFPIKIWLTVEAVFCDKQSILFTETERKPEQANINPNTTGQNTPNELLKWLNAN
jgi:hypothetical protein